MSIDLTLDYGTYPNGKAVGHGFCANGGQSSLSCNAASPCVPGYYYGWAQFTITYPPDYEPPSYFGAGGSGRPAALISCT